MILCGFNFTFHHSYYSNCAPFRLLCAGEVLPLRLASARSECDRSVCGVPVFAAACSGDVIGQLAQSTPRVRLSKQWKDRGTAVTSVNWLIDRPEEAIGT
ncbi:hypothetical protein scyTo_0000262 [Scyliorhinus torazame]|uniref:Uncharacterized protein n=1 Tax=Scyliorhinus torazame TaxID=75743 RepID=A0A401NTY9_SCYTO|nr:hypothetical protein [Scyliorhinus torazame]